MDAAPNKEAAKPQNFEFAVPAMSAIGPKQTSASALHMSAFGGKRTLKLLRQLTVRHTPVARRPLRQWLIRSATE
jgi:hypothetical protein